MWGSVLVSWPGIETLPLALEVQCLNHCTTREVLPLELLSPLLPSIGFWPCSYLLFWKDHLNVVIRHLLCLASFTEHIFLRFIYVFVCPYLIPLYGLVIFILLHEWIPLFIQSSANGHCFQFRVKSKAVLSICVQVCVLEFAFISLWGMPMS